MKTAGRTWAESVGPKGRTVRKDLVALLGHRGHRDLPGLLGYRGRRVCKARPVQSEPRELPGLPGLSALQAPRENPDRDVYKRQPLKHSLET